MAAPRTPLLTVDCVVLDPTGRILMIRRKHEPYEGHLALPGGFVDIGETVEAACRRELAEETGLTAGRLILVGVYSDPDRDPRGHTCSVAFLTRVGKAKALTATAGDDAATVEWTTDWRRARLAFDHRRIVADAIKLADKAVTAGARRGT